MQVLTKEGMMSAYVKPLGPCLGLEHTLETHYHILCLNGLELLLQVRLYVCKHQEANQVDSSNDLR